MVGMGVPEHGGWKAVSEEEAGGLVCVCVGECGAGRGRAEEEALRETEEADFCGCVC